MIVHIVHTNTLHAPTAHCFMPTESEGSVHHVPSPRPRHSYGPLTSVPLLIWFKVFLSFSLLALTSLQPAFYCLDRNYFK